MNLLGRKKDNPQPEDADASAPASATAAGDTGLTAPKGRPTPKRSEASRKRGPVAPAPLTTAEARKRRKELAASKPKLSREERKAEKVARRAAMTERRERMMAGDDAYLLPRDKGPVRRYARDIVDSRRNLLGLFMPVALALVLITLAVPAVEVQRWVSYGMPVLLVVMAIDGVLVGRRVNRMVDAKFPSNTESGFKLGFYAASRASQLRRMRAPRPMVNRGDDV